MSTDVMDRFDSGKPCQVLILTSRKAGSGASRDQIPRLEILVTAADATCRVVATASELKQRLQERSATHDCIVVAAGGDGTLSLAAASIQSAELAGDVPIVPMPMGTENLLARHLGHTADAESVLRSIRHGSSYWLDAGATDGRLFLIMATCGFDAEVVRGMHLTRRGHISRFSYLRPILRAIFRYRFPQVIVRVDGGEPIECCWAMVFNLPRYGAALRIEPDAVGDDGKMNVIAFTGGSIFGGLRYVVGIWLGRHQRFRDVVRCQGSSIEITAHERVPYQLDGDYAGRLPLKIETIPRSVHLLLPA